MHDKLSNGRSYKMLTVLDELMRQALAVVTCTKMGADGVLEALYPLLLSHGSPEYFRSDNGTERGDARLASTRWHQANPHLPGSPWENGYNERFNGTLRREVLNAEWFTTTEQAQIVINHWLWQYNYTRPHQALDMRPTVPETLLEKPPLSGPDTGG